MKNQLSVKNSMLYNSIGSISYWMCQWLNTILIVRLADFEQAGIFSLVVTFTNIFSIIASYGVKGYQVSDLEPKYSDGIYIGMRVVTCVTSFALCIAVALFSSFNTAEMSAIVLYMVYRTIEAFIDVFQGIFQKAWRMDYICYSFLLRGVCTTMAFGGLLYFTKSLNISLAGIVILTALIAVLFDLSKLNKLTSSLPKFDFAKIKGLILACTPLVISGILMTLSASIPRFFIENYYGKEMLGIFSSVASPTLIIQVAAGFVIAPLITVFAQHYAARQPQQIVKLFIKCTIVITAAAVLGIAGAAVFGDFGLKLLFGEEILAYRYLLMPMIISSVLTGFQIFVMQINVVLRDYKGILISGTAGAVISIAFSPYFIKKFSLSGGNIVIISALIAQVVLLFVFAAIKMRKEFKTGIHQ